MKYLFTVIILLFTLKVSSCVCASVGVVDRFERSDFVATAEIENITPDSKKGYHQIEIRIIEIFKGERVNKLKIKSILSSSCAFYTPKKTKWLIFANDNGDDDLVFGACYGAVNLDRKIDDKKYPTARKKIKNSIERKLAMLRLLKESNLKLNNSYNLKYSFTNDCLDSFKGVELKEKSFALFKIKVSKNLKVERVEVIKGLGVQVLNDKLIDCFKHDFGIYRRGFDEIPNSTEIAVGIYYYMPDDIHKSFISVYDL